MSDNPTTPPDDGRTEPKPDSPLGICPKCGKPSYRCECASADQPVSKETTTSLVDGFRRIREEGIFRGAQAHGAPHPFKGKTVADIKPTGSWWRMGWIIYFTDGTWFITHPIGDQK